MQTKSLLERLYLADARRKDLELRFGTLSRPSTKLRAEMNRTWQEEERGGGGEGGGEGGSETGVSPRNFLHGNVPGSVVIAPVRAQNFLFFISHISPVSKNELFKTGF